MVAYKTNGERRNRQPRAKERTTGSISPPKAGCAGRSTRRWVSNREQRVQLIGAGPLVGDRKTLRPASRAMKRRNALAIRSGLRVVIDAEPDLVVVGEGDDGAAVNPVVRRLRPELARGLEGR